MTFRVCGEEDGEQEKLVWVLTCGLPQALLLPIRAGEADSVGLGAVLEARAGSGAPRRGGWRLRE